MHTIRRSISNILVLIFFALVASHNRAQTAAELIEIQFEELISMEIEVESAGKQATKVFDLPYATHVITADDLKRYNIQNIPDALRMAPGTLVEQMGAGEWGVSIRGVGGRFSRYVLILLNGRALNNAAFSGVNWDEVNISIQNIQRIEVIRGPNASSWGANAVNGIINIITHRAGDKSKSRMRLSAGDTYLGSAEVFHGNDISQQWYNSFSAHISQQQGLKNQSKSLQEKDQEDWRLSYFIEKTSKSDNLLLSLSHFESKHSSYLVLQQGPNLLQSENVSQKHGSALQVSYSKQLSKATSFRGKMSYDHVNREFTGYDWDSRHIQAEVDGHYLLKDYRLDYGLSYKNTDSFVYTNESFPIQLSKNDTNVEYIGAFISGSANIPKYDFSIKLATRVDHNNFTGTQYQPSLRGLWKSSESDRFWFGLSRGASIPSTAVFNSTESIIEYIPATTSPYPVFIYAQGDDYAPNTIVDAVEAGYRHIWENMNIDISLFRSSYHNDIGVEVSTAPPSLSNFPPDQNTYLIQEAFFKWNRDFDTKGLELSYLARIHDKGSLALSYSYVELEEQTPGVEHLASLQIDVQLTHFIDVSLWARYSSGNDTYITDGYSVADINIHYTPSPSLQFTYTAKSLGKSRYIDGRLEVFSFEGYLVEQGHYLSLTWEF